MSNNQHHGFLDSLKNMVVDETPDAPTAHVSTPAVSAPSAAPTTPFSFNASFTPTAPTAAAPYAPPTSSNAAPSLSSFVNAAPTSGPEAEEYYQKLAAKTDFENTDIAGKLHQFLDPLANLPLDPAMKFKTAVAMAKAQGMTEDSILGAFDNMKAALTQAQDSFNSHAAAFEAKEITARQSRLTEIQNQISNLQAEQTQLGGELADAQAKSARTQSGFKSALQRRGAEIDQQKAQYAAMLK